jgi:hypothetical protein
MEGLKTLPQETLDLLAQHFKIDPNPDKFMGIWIFRGDKFIKPKTGEVYVIEQAFFNRVPVVIQGVKMDTGWRYLFRHTGTKVVSNISSDVLHTLFKSGALMRSKAELRIDTEDVIKIKKIVSGLNFAEITEVEMVYGKSKITDLAKFISSHYIGINSVSEVVYRNSVYNLVTFFKTVGAWPQT